jgi:hypothetical protein
VPTIIPGYVYSLFAALLVGVILVYTCSVATVNIKADANQQQLKNIEQYVAAQSLTLISHTTQNQNTTQSLDIPPQIGNQLFWIRITNDSSTAWVESGFGDTALSSDVHEAIPAQVAASGSFISGSGRPLLECYLENGVATLTLTQE